MSDFIACSQGVWWYPILPGEEFLDGPDEPSTRRQGPKLHNFRPGDLQKEEQHSSGVGYFVYWFYANEASLINS